MSAREMIDAEFRYSGRPVLAIPVALMVEQWECPNRECGFRYFEDEPEGCAACETPLRRIWVAYPDEAEDVSLDKAAES